MRLQPSPFDTEHYAIRVGRLVMEAGDGPQAFCEILDHAWNEGYEVLFSRVQEDDPGRRLIEAAGCSPLEVLVTSTLRAAEHTPVLVRDVHVEDYDRLEASADIDAVCAIAAAVLTGSHLHVDTRLPQGCTRQLFASWTRNDVVGRAQRTFLARIGKEPVGFITVITTESEAVIDLVAVREDLHGRGVGSALLARSLDWIASKHSSVRIGTQANNPALQLYAKFGFVPTARHVTYHLWPDHKK